MTLEHYAQQVHASNFICGLGRHCLAGQPCVPVPKLDWLVLYSVQQWNFYMNSLYEAVQNAVILVRDAGASAISDFTPVATANWIGLTITVAALAGIVLATASVFMVFGPILQPLVAGAALAAEASVAGESAAASTAAVAGESVAASTTAAAAAPKLVRRHHKETSSTDKFAAYAKLNNDISVLHSKLNAIIKLNFDSVLSCPISSDCGVYNIANNGTYLTPNTQKSELQEDARRLAQLIMLSELFKSLKMFVVIGSRKCDRKGPNGSLEGNDVLSYCNKDGLMMNIVRADGDKMNENIPNGNLVAAKYGFTTEYLISLARECQEKFQLHKSESINSSSHTSSFNKSTLADTANHTGCDCPFNLPVCDTRIPEIWKRIEKHDDIVIACREAGNLAI